MEKKRKKIIVACGCSEYSTRLFAHAVKMALGLDAEIIVVNVINQTALEHVERALGCYAVFDMEDYVEKLKTDRTRFVEKQIQATGHANFFKKTIIKTGVPFQVLLGAINKEKVNLVVMGNKGRGNIAGVLLGSCAEKLYRRCPAALLSVRVDREEGML